MPIRIRAARPNDAARLSAFAAATFLEAFADGNDPDDMASYIADAFTPERQAAEIADPGGIVLLAEAGDGAYADELVGYAHVRSGRPAEAVADRPAPIELKRLYVARAWRGRAVAQALMDAVLEFARERGARTLWLGVWKQNERALAFYGKYGFSHAGEHDFVLGSDVQTDWILARPVDAPAPVAPETRSS